MGDRTQNINIVYKVNTVDVERASQTLNKAKAANDALVKSAQDLGVQGSKSANQFSQTIAGLTLQMQQLKAQIELTNQSDTKRLNDLNAQYRAMNTQLDGYKKSLDTTNSATQKTTASITDLYGAVKLLLTAGLVKELIDISVSMATLAGKVQGVSTAFQKLPNSIALLQKLRDATHGTIDDLTLMQKALQAQNFGIPIEKLGMLLEFAATRAQQTGISVDYLVDSIVTGLGRNSVKILDNLQLNIGELKKRMKETGDTMQTVAIQMIGESLKKMNSYVETSETKVNQLKSSWENFKISLATGPVGQASSWVVDQLTSILDIFKGSGNATLDSATRRVNDFMQANEALLKSEKGVQAVERELDALRKEHLQNTIKERDETEKFHKAMDEGNKEDAKSAAQNATAIHDHNDEITQEIYLFEQLEKTIRNKTAFTKEDIEVQEEERKIEENRLVTGRLLRKEIEDEIDALVKRTDAIRQSILPQGAQPKGGFQQPLGPQPLNDGGNSNAANFKTWYDQYATFWDKIVMGFDDMGKRIRKSTDMTVEDQRRQWENAAKQLTNSLIGALGTILTAQNQAQTQALDNQITATKAYYDQQINLAGNNATAKAEIQHKEDEALKKLQKERDQAAQRQAIRAIMINTAMAIIKALAEVPWPYSLAVSAAAAITGAAQLSAAKRAPQGYAEGVIDLKGPGTTKSDSIPANLSRGESVMTAEQTASSMGILKAIRARRLDDKIINDLVAKAGGWQGNKFDDSRIVSAIKSQKYPDIIRHGATIYEAKEVGKNSKKYVRSKFLS